MYSKQIQAIHNEFNTAGEVLLEQAKTVLKSSSKTQADKIAMLKSIGFTASTEVVQGQKVLEQVKLSKEIADMVNYYSTRYPNQKFITKEQVDTICTKYKLSCGPVDTYTGFVPEKNAQEIADFTLKSEDVVRLCKISKIDFYGHANSEAKKLVEEFVKKNNAVFSAHLINEFHGYPSSYMGGVDPGSFLSYQGDKKNGKYCPISSVKHTYTFPPLSICAPKKDFNTKNMSIMGNFLESLNSVKFETIPDPVVLQPVNSGFLVLSAWGNESEDPALLTDPILTNPKLN